MKVWAAICPLCQQPVPLRGQHEAMPAEQQEAKLLEHMALHPLREWAMTVQQLRDQLHNKRELDRVPCWAMPRA